MATTIEVAVFLQPEGIDGHGRATAIGGTAQDPRTRGVVNVQVFILRASVPIDEVIEEVIGERGRGATMDLPRLVGVGRDLLSSAEQNGW